MYLNDSRVKEHLGWVVGGNSPPHGKKTITLSGPTTVARLANAFRLSANAEAAPATRSRAMKKPRKKIFLFVSSFPRHAASRAEFLASSAGGRIRILRLPRRPGNRTPLHPSDPPPPPHTHFLLWRCINRRRRRPTRLLLALSDGGDGGGGVDVGGSAAEEEAGRAGADAGVKEAAGGSGGRRGAGARRRRARGHALRPRRGRGRAVQPARRIPL